MHAAGGKGAPAGSRLILSHHDYERTPDLETLQGILRRMADAGADVPKVACVANDVADSARMLRLIAEAPSTYPSGRMGCCMHVCCVCAAEGLLLLPTTCPASLSEAMLGGLDKYAAS